MSVGKVYLIIFVPSMPADIDIIYHQWAKANTTHWTSEAETGLFREN